MKFFMTLILMFSFSAFAQNAKIERATDQPIPPSDSDAKAKPEAVAPSTTAQEQQQSPGVDNTFMEGPYDRKGEYIFFDRAEKEARESEEEAAEQM